MGLRGKKPAPDQTSAQKKASERATANYHAKKSAEVEQKAAERARAEAHIDASEDVKNAKKAPEVPKRRTPLPSEVRRRLATMVARRRCTQFQADWMWEHQWLPQLRIIARTDFDTFAELVCVDDDSGEPIEQAPIHKCWTQLRKQYDRLLIWSHCESGKTTQNSILNTVWELGVDPTLRFAILSNTSKQATNILRAIAAYIERNPEVRAIFPHLRPDPQGPWTTTDLRVIRTGNAKEPSVCAIGVHGALTGYRVDRLIVDDILDPENCDTDANRKKLEAWYKAVAVGRLTKRARILVIGTAYHSQDLLHNIAKQRGFRWFRFPIIRKDGTLSWPEQWPLTRVNKRKSELGPAEFARQMLCKARDDDEARFKQEWIDTALAAGDGLAMLPRIEFVPEGCMTFTGVDVAAAQGRKSDKCAFFTFIQDAKGNRRILDITHGKFTGPEIINTIADLHSRYKSLIAVESNGVQLFLHQFAAAETNLPIVPFQTGAGKWNPQLGVEGLAIELFNQKWIFPNQNKLCTPGLERFVEEMLYYNPRQHTGDILMASYFARDLARRVMTPGGSGADNMVEARVVGADPKPMTKGSQAASEEAEAHARAAEELAAAKLRFERALAGGFQEME